MNFQRLRSTLQHSLRQQFAATFVEYIVIASILGLVTLYMVAYFEPEASRFHNDLSEGMFIPYPTNYIPPP